MAKITINGVSIDPVTHGPELAALALSTADASNSNYALVQVRGPLGDDEKAQLKAAGCQLLEYVPENTYVVRFPGNDLSAVRALPFVAWANPYLKGFKVNPDLGGVDPTANPVALMAREGALDAVRDTHRRVTLVLQKGAEKRDLRKKIAAAAGLNPDDIPAKQRRITLNIPTSRLKDLADIDEIRHIEPAPEHTLFNDVAARIIGFGALQGGIPGIAGLDGSGQIVAVCDTGFDKGSTTATHPAFRGRVLRIHALGRPTGNDPDGHGTHVCGSVLGDQAVASFGHISGAAPGAELVVQSVLTSTGSLGGLPDDLNDLFAVAYEEDKARIHSNSWGNSLASSHRMYDAESEQVDEFIRAHRDLTICFAAGNDGIDENANGIVDAGSVSPPGTAKNCVTVGASESERPSSPTYGSVRPSFFPVDPLRHDPSANNAAGLAAFSSRGLTEDGRIKPDVVAPGTSILSTLSRDAQLKTVFGANPPPGYMYDTGTSMATPLVAGCAALVRQFLARDRAIANPSAALVKAMLINGAVSLGGQFVPSEAGSVPNPDQGFGRVDMKRTVDGAFELHDEGEVLSAPGASQEFQTRTGSDGALKVTLVWTDPPGSTLQNDLDLIVRVGAQETHGNGAPGAPGFDRINNVEQVLLSGLPPDTPATVVVQAFRIALEPQDFALVIRRGA